MKKNLFSISALLYSLLSISYGGVSEKANLTCKRANVAETSTLVTASKDILFKYYDTLLQKYPSLEFDFDRFCENYSKSSLTIDKFTESYMTANSTQYIEVNSINSSSSSDADYILNSIYDYNTTPSSEFIRYPIYIDTSIYSNLFVGDFIIETETEILNGLLSHCAAIVNLNKPYFNNSSSNSYYIQTIEAVGSGVKFGFLDDERLCRFGVGIFRHQVLKDSEKTLYTQFLYKQLGKQYLFHVGKANSSINSNKWYCSELVWAAYNYIGYDIYKIDGTSYGLSGNNGVIDPKLMEFANGNSEVNLGNKFLRMRCIKIDSNVYTIQIYSSYSNNITFDYLPYSISKESAIQWNNLDSEIITDTVYAYSFVAIDYNYTSGEYFTAACYHTNDNITYSYITYSKPLNTEGRSLIINYYLRYTY